MKTLVIIALILGLATGSYADPLIKANNFNYLGAFRVPASDPMSYSGSAIAYNPANNSLFIMGNVTTQNVAEISIPALVNSPIISNLNSAAMLQSPTDITEGNRRKLAVDPICAANGKSSPCDMFSGSSVEIAGLTVYNNKLIGTSVPRFDGANAATLSHFLSGLDLSVLGDFVGMKQVGDFTGNSNIPNPSGAMVGGWMTKIPAGLQASLGGTFLTGQGTLSNVARTSYGPSAFSFDPAQIGVVNPVPATPLLYYPSGHKTLGDYGDQGLGYHGGTNVNSVVMVNGSRSVLFFGYIGIGENDYGGATNNPVFADPCTAPDTCVMSRGYSVCADPNNCTTGHKATPNDPLCNVNAGLGCVYDPLTGTEGPHAYPYIYQIWAYDADDLAAVKAGTKNAWDVVPYATWELNTLGSPVDLSADVAVTYDDVNGILYVSEPGVDKTGCCIFTPLIHAFSINLSATPASTYKVGGQVMLLNGSVTLQNNGGNNLVVISGNRATTQTMQFTTGISPGSPYNVTIASQPAGQTCSVLNGSGTVNANADITTVIVTCTGSGVSAPINGACGSVSGTTVPSLNSGSANLCTGTVTSFAGTGPWTWGCNGLNGGTNTASNACSASYSAGASTTTASPAGGTYSGTQTVSLTCSGTCSSVQYCTTSNSCTPSTNYTGPITVSATGYLRHRGGVSDTIFTESYTITAPVQGTPSNRLYGPRLTGGVKFR